MVDGPMHRLMFALVVGCLGGGVGAPPQVAWGASPSPREARAWLAMPKGSTSLGRTNGGQLVGAVELPKKGVGYQVLSHAAGRKTNFGTAELIGVIARATRKVREAFPGSVLGIGNLGFEDGRKIPWSVSHQAGRDADLGMYATTRDGKSLQAMPFVAFGADGTAERAGAGGVGKVRFDLPRNLALVVALVEDPEARVQYIFVADWLKQMLLGEARRAGVGAATITRLQEVLHQPSDSNPHADHYHVRLFCTVEDRQYGCLDRGPARAWVDPGDREHAEAARKVASILEMRGKGSEALQVQALERLGAMMATSELDAVVGALSASSKKVHEAALATVIALGDARAAEGIVRTLREVEDAAWAVALFEAVPRLDADALVPLAERVLASGGVEGLLHPKVVKAAGPKVRVAALAVLRDRGRAEHVPRLVELAGDKDRAVQKAALAALQHRTCQPFGDAKAFAAWLGREGRASELEWIEAGLRERRVKLPSGLRSKDAVGRLIALLDRKDPALRLCAWRALVAITGHDEDWRNRPPVRNRKHWESWWAGNSAMVALP